MLYSYELEHSLTESYVELQAEKLIKEGFIFNSEEWTYDLYEKKYEEKEYIDFYYTEEIEVDSQLGEYKVYKNRKSINIKYKITKKEKWFTGFFKNIFNSFVFKTEENVSQSRIWELELLLAQWYIKDFQKIESFNIIGAIEKLTDNEIRELQKKNIKYSFIRNLDETKKEKIKNTNKQLGLEKEEFEKNYKNEFDIEIINHFKKKVLKEKIVVERRIVSEINVNFYIPGIWSRSWNHEHWTKAEFSCEVTIEYISWFNPFDKKYFKKDEIKEKIIEIIEKEHYNTTYIRVRDDKKDWFNIDSTTIN